MSARAPVALALSALLMGAWPHAAGADLRAAAESTRIERFVARAFAPDGGRRLYVERHRVELRGGRPLREQVTYHRPGSGRVFARKQLRYGRDLAAPDFEFEDLRSGRLEAAERRGLNWVVTHRPSRSDAREIEVLRAGRPLIVDEGYRNLLADGYARLQRRGALVAEAIVPSRLAAYDMRFRGRGEVRRGGRGLLHVRLDMDALLLRLVGPSADLYLDPESRRLQEFVGLANIRDDDDGLQQARIRYRYD